MMKLKCSIVMYLLLLVKVQAQPEPNIILVIADDMGWSQVSTGLTNLNNPSDFYETPNLETLASEGIAFPYAYVNGANCAPTRAALLSGQYAARPTNNVFAVNSLNRGGNSTLLIGPDNGLPNGEDQIPASAITLAESMKTAGYTTVHLGKLHVGENEGANVSNNAATDQGFDYNYGGGSSGHPSSYFASNSGVPYTFVDSVGPELDPYASPYTEAESIALSIDHANYPLTGTAKHLTDAMADAAIDFMDANSASPFFMHFSNYAIHGPFALNQARPDLRAKYSNKKQNSPSSMGHDRQPGQAALAEGMDQAIGRLIAYLKATDDPRNPGHKLSENTLVHFISDNGGAIHSDDAGPLRGMKGEYYEGGIRSVTISWSEAPWLANKGTVNTTPIVAFDLYPTFVDMANGTLPAGYAIDGHSLWPLLNVGTAPSRTSLFWHFPGYLIDSKRNARPTTTIRKGDYKLIHNYETADYELYNLITDISEVTNLLPSSEQNIIDLANEMITDMRNHLIDTSAPLPTYRSNGETVPMPDYIGSTEPEPSVLIAHYKFDNDYTDETNNLPLINSNFEVASFTVSESANNDPYVGGYYFNSTGTTPANNAKLVSHDGSGFLLIPSSITGNNPRTITAWVKTTETTERGIVMMGNASVRFGIELLGSGHLGAVAGTETLSSDIAINDDQWHHVALTYENGTPIVYIDGVAKSGTWSTVNTPGSTAVVVAAHKDTGKAWIGGLDDVRIYSGVLSASEVSALATGGTLGIEDNRITDTFKAYPNPVNDILTITSKTVSSQLGVAIYNMLGAKVRTKVYQANGEACVDMGRLASGFYSVIVTADGKQSSLKILKK